MRKQKDMTPEDGPPRSEGVQYATGERGGQLLIAPESVELQWEESEVAWPKQKWRSVADLSGGESEVWWFKEQYCIGIWNVRSMNQGKLEMVKHLERVNTDILGINILVN